MRFALLEMKMALLFILSRFDLVPTESTPEKIEFDPTARFPQSKVPLKLKAVQRS